MRKCPASLCDRNTCPKPYRRTPMPGRRRMCTWPLLYLTAWAIFMVGMGAPAVAEPGPCDALSKAIDEYRRGNYFDFRFEKRVTSECRTLVEKHGVPELTGQLLAMLPEVDSDVVTSNHRFALNAICTLRPSWAVSEIVRGVQGKNVQWRCLVAAAGLQDRRAQQALKQFMKDEALHRGSDDMLFSALSESFGSKENRVLRKLAARLLAQARIQNYPRRESLYWHVCSSQKIEDMPDVTLLCAREPKPIEYSSRSHTTEFLMPTVVLILLGGLLVAVGIRSSDNSDRRFFSGWGGALACMLPGGIIGWSLAYSMDTSHDPLSVIILVPGGILGCIAGLVLGGLIGSYLGDKQPSKE